MRREQITLKRRVCQEKLEEWLRTAMAREAEQIEAGPDLVRRIKVRLLAHQGKGRTMFIGWRKAAVATICGALLVSGLVFGLSPGARAWANKAVISPVLSIVHTVIRADGSYAVTKLQTTAKVQMHVGFPVHLPTYLPEGYRLISITTARQEKSGQGFVSVVYGVPGGARKRLQLTITNECGSLRNGGGMQEVEVRGKKAYWARYSIMEVSGAGEEPAARVAHMLKWGDKGLVYKLEDGSGTLSLEEMLKIAESIN